MPPKPNPSVVLRIDLADMDRLTGHAQRLGLSPRQTLTRLLDRVDGTQRSSPSLVEREVRRSEQSAREVVPMFKKGAK